MPPDENMAAMNAAAVDAVLMIGPPERNKPDIARDLNRRWTTPDWNSFQWRPAFKRKRGHRSGSPFDEIEVAQFAIRI
jgi:hypothetical protein